MTYRSDHDAAIARGDALERELDATEAELEKANTDRARLEAEVAELRAKQPAPSPAVSSDDEQLVDWSATLNDNEHPSDWRCDPEPPDHRFDWLAWGLPLGGLLFVFVILLVVWATG